MNCICCGLELKPGAVRCLRCDTRQDGKKEKKPIRWFRWVGGAAMLLIILLAVPFMVGTSGGGDRSTDAFYAAQSAIGQRLKIPKSARFESRHAEGNSASVITNNIYLAFGRVESMNSFGVMIPGKWAVILRDDASGFQILRTALGEDEYLDLWQNILPKYETAQAATGQAPN